LSLLNVGDASVDFNVHGGRIERFTVDGLDLLVPPERN
jgi:hypothetical protein